MAAALLLLLMIPGLLLLIGVVIARLLGGGARTMRRVAEGKCIHCGYDLRASPLRCPECGKVAVRFSILNPDDLSTFEKAYAIYAEAINAAEQKPRDVMIQMLRREDYRFVVAWRQATVAGLAVLFVAPTADFSLLEYLAIRLDVRGQGLGSELFQETSRLAASSLGAMPGPMLIEAEAEAHAPQSSDPPKSGDAAQPGEAPRDGTESPASPGAHLSQAARRQAFYRRQGCRRIADLHYILPLGDGSAPPMELLAFRPPENVTRDELRSWLSIIYSRVYGRPHDDRRIALMLETVGNPVRRE
jgi:GNAT superfamily N-acetyltransferase